MKKFILPLSILLVFFPIFSAMAVVDMKNAGFSKTFIDLSLPSEGFSMDIARTYSSRSIFNGMFGYGQCYSLETTLVVNSDSSLQVTECGGGLEKTYRRSAYNLNTIEGINKKILGEVKKRNPVLTKRYLKDLERKLKVNRFLREEFASRLELKGKVVKNQRYVLNKIKNDYVVYEGQRFIRYLPNNTKQIFDRNGMLVQILSRSGQGLSIERKKDGRIAKVSNNQGAWLSFAYDPKNQKKVKQVLGSNGKRASYTYAGDNLKTSIDENKLKITYFSDAHHNIKKIVYPDKTNVRITYNVDKDWVMSFKDKRNCLETYNYGEDKKRPLDHYWSEVKKVCRGVTTHQAKYEFFHKVAKDKRRYLAKTVSNINGLVSVVEYHGVFGKPTLVQKGRRRVKVSYNKAAQIQTKDEGYKKTVYAYNPKCVSVSRATEQYYVGKKQKKKIVKKLAKTVKSWFNYNKNCVVVKAKNSEGLSVKVQYYPKKQNKIYSLQDQTKKLIVMRYDKIFGKPKSIERPGVGVLKVRYAKNGSILPNFRGVSGKLSPIVSQQIIQVINNYLQVIRPISTQTVRI